ncbi:MAG: hypothetical protein MR555_08145 [Spirochaetia bacterium]|nr:hypothetical protein [Spirochaetia bacterium]
MENEKTDETSQTQEQNSVPKADENEELTFKDKLLALAFFCIPTGIFAWNSHVIVYNFSIHDGYFWAILAIIVNLGILLSSSRILGLVGVAFFEKFSFWKKITDDIDKGLNKLKIIAFVFFILMFIVFGPILGRPGKGSIEKGAVQVVNQMLEENLGKNAPECTDVEIISDLGNGAYIATAFLDNGNTIHISIQYYKKTSQIEVYLQ